MVFLEIRSNLLNSKMQRFTLTYPALWEVENDPALSKKYRLDFRRVNDVSFNSVREKALSRHLESMVQLIVWAKNNLKQKETLAWVSFFERLDLKDSNLHEFYLKGYIMNHMSDILRVRKFKESDLVIIANHPVLRDWVLNSFVDYGTLRQGQYYARLITELNPENLEQETFKKSLILTQYYLDGNVSMMKKWSEALSRYPTNSSYFPIINGRVWAARFINQMLKTGALRKDLVQDWFVALQEEPLSSVMPSSIEPLPILVRFAEDVQQIEEILNYVGFANHVCILNNPLAASIDKAVYLASKTAFLSRIKDITRAQEYRTQLYQNMCLPSYQNYIFGIANAF